MNWRRPGWSILHRRRSHFSQEAEAALFQRLRIRLTLWYCGVLGAALILFSFALYFGAQYFFFQPYKDMAQFHATGHVGMWQSGQMDNACPSSGQGGQFGPPGQGFLMTEMVMCFDTQGNLLPNENISGLPSAFITNTLVQSALQNGQASDMVNAGGTTGWIYRYTQVVPNPDGSGNIGVIVIGENINAQVNALSLLLILLLSLGGAALVGAGVGGLFLSNRALAPARLAWSNQQRFIADAAHELRTPLTLLRADAEVLLRGRKRFVEEDAELLDDIVAETTCMSTIATNLLTLARLDTGTLQREHEVVNLAALSQEAAQRVQALAAQQHITMQVEHSGDLYVIGDPVLLEQAVLCLLDNAIKYNREGGRISVRTIAQDEKVLLEVRDTGIGIADEHLPHMGERFYRVDKARSREAGGTGLGLSIARSIAVAHHGTLRLSSIPEQETTVTLALPLANVTAPKQINEASSSMESLPEQR
ncbi:MAG TPA: ATP-binding protein [Ktedonobacteraceae bacterium]|nr:ATP-binding protein [Ktedonobacteraceae bacterium]